MRLAFDIETCPLPAGTYSERQQRRREMERGRQLRQKPEMDERDADRLVRSTHPHLGWICAAAVAYRVDGEIVAWSRAVGTPDEEINLIDDFATQLDAVGFYKPVSFNGKRFDGPFIKMRSLRHGPVPGAVLPLLHDHRYQDSPHMDLMHKVPMGFGLADVCEMVGVATPKGDLDGSGVAAAIRRGETDRVAEYCKLDTLATLACYEALAIRGAL